MNQKHILLTGVTVFLSVVFAMSRVHAQDWPDPPVDPTSVDYIPFEDWAKVPVNFFGKVVDEKNRLLEGTTIQIKWADSRGELVQTNVVSKADGKFSVTGLGGKAIALTIHVEKEGYYPVITGPRDMNFPVKSSQRTYFHYGEGHSGYYRFIADPKNPVVFWLRKMGELANLVLLEKSCKVPKDGTPVEISLLTGKIMSAGQGHLKVECKILSGEVGIDPEYPGVKGFDWKCKVSVPGGGLVETNEEFPFEAPADGYRSTDEIDMLTSLGRGWHNSIEKQYFLKLKDGNYARVQFTMVPHGDCFFSITSYLNPFKSRNLESAEEKTVKASTTLLGGVEKAFEKLRAKAKE